MHGSKATSLSPIVKMSAYSTVSMSAFTMSSTNKATSRSTLFEARADRADRKL